MDLLLRVACFCFSVRGSWEIPLNVVVSLHSHSAGAHWGPVCAGAALAPGLRVGRQTAQEQPFQSGSALQRENYNTPIINQTHNPKKKNQMLLKW